MTRAFFETCLKEEMGRVKEEVGADRFTGGRFKEAINLFRRMSTSRTFETFLTLPAYQKIV